MTQPLVFQRNFDVEVAQEIAAHASEGPKTYSEADLARVAKEAEAKGFSAGFGKGKAEGLDEARAEIAAGTEASLATLVPVLTDFAAEVCAHQNAMEHQTLGYALSLCETLFPRLLNHFGAKRTEEQIQDLVKQLQGRPGVTLHVPEAVAADIEARLPMLTAGSHDPCEIAVQAEPNLSKGEAKLTWDDGFAALNQDALCRAILRDLRTAWAETTPKTPPTKEG